MYSLYSVWIESALMSHFPGHVFWHAWRVAWYESKVSVLKLWNVPFTGHHAFPFSFLLFLTLVYHLEKDQFVSTIMQHSHVKSLIHLTFRERRRFSSNSKAVTLIKAPLKMLLRKCLPATTWRLVITWNGGPHYVCQGVALWGADSKK